MKLPRSALVLAPLALAVAGLGDRASADTPAGAAFSVPLFTITKSENRNHVQYALRVDAQCTPLSTAPVFAYWKMLEKGPDRTESLLFLEQRAYGIASQRPVTEGPDQGKIRLVLRAVPSRVILVDVKRRADGSCDAGAALTIGGAQANLYNVYARLKWPFGVEYLDLSGWSLDATHVVSERMER